MLKVSNLVTTYLYHPTINSTCKKISDVRSGCRRGKNGSNLSGQSYVNAFLGACRLSHLIFVKVNLFPSNIRDLWYAIHTKEGIVKIVQKQLFTMNLK